MQSHTNSTQLGISNQQSQIGCQDDFLKIVPFLQLFIPIRRLSQYLELYRWRMEHQKYLICFEWVKIQPFSDQEVLVYFKKTQGLTLLKDILSVQCNYVFQNIGKLFKEFKTLFDKFGPFQLEPEMVAFDSQCNPYVWMFSKHIKIEYKRDYVSEQQFSLNIVELLIKFQHKFEDKNVISELHKVKDKQYCLQEMIRHFQECQQIVVQLQSQKKNEQGEQQVTQLTFNKNKAKKKNGAKRMNKSMNTSFSSSFLTHFTRSILDSQKESQENKILKEEQMYTESSLPTFSKTFKTEKTNINCPQEEHQLDKSFNFEIAPQTPIARPHTNQLNLFVSVTLESEGQEQKQKKKEKQILVLPKLDKYNRCLVDSVESEESQ